MKLSIIIPVYNEEKTIKQIIDRVRNVKLPNGIKKEIIVIDDGSIDNSKFKIKNLKFGDIKKVFHERNLGKGAAIRSGLKLATGDFIIIQDADLEYDPTYYSLLLKPILENQARIVYGTRLINYPLKLWGEDKTVLPTHLIANRLLTGLTNLLYRSNLTDMETCYKVFKTSCLKGINLNSNKFDFEPEITAKFLKKGFRIFEIPIKVKPRSYRQGKKISWIDGLKAVFALFKFRFSD
ncbi:MAG: glycosyltransferase family 2 protein [Patescibacteria group bacterium]